MENLIQHLPFTVDLELIRKLDRNGPRYTSYPTADRFTETFVPESYIAATTAARGPDNATRPLSLYVHLPFCKSVCFYCACNKIATRNHAKAKQYLDYLGREIALQSALLQDNSRVEQMHWGGGTPTFYDMEELSALFRLLRANFDFSSEGEYSIEIDPRTVDSAGVAALRRMGFNRVSLGVQDFDPDVQRAVNRVQSEEQTLAVIDAARHEGFLSINIDLIYGLPRQNLMTFNRTLARVIAASPDRIAIYNYAHLPTRFKSQRRIVDAELPAPETKLKLLALAARRLVDAGYVYIGMDHFAKPDDALAVAQREGRLHRNFQGYSTHAECDLVALGVSAIGQIGATYSQNHRDLDSYYASVDHGVLPIARGIALSDDDLLRRAVIQALICNFTLDMAEMERSYHIVFKEYFCYELRELKTLAGNGLVELDDESINITPKGRLLARNVCMVFDKYLRQDVDARKFSRVL